MRSIIICLAVLSIAVSSAMSQNTYYSMFNYNGFIPRVIVNDRSVTLQAGLYATVYENRSAQRDVDWVTRHDSAIVTFWEQEGDNILHIMRELSGLEWREVEFSIYLVRHFPTIGSSDPLIVPIGGMGEGAVFEVAPDGSRLALNLLFQLARRMLSQASRAGYEAQFGIAYHPLMRPGPYRLDNLALLLALKTGENVLGIDSIYAAYNSAFWIHHTPGRQVFEDFFWNQWVLTPERPLAQWIAAEPYSSDLVSLTRPPHRVKGSTGRHRQLFVEGLPLKGRLGLSTRIDESGRLAVDRIDTFRLAYACGLREGDRIHSVEGYRVRSHKELVEQVLEHLEYSGATLEIIREGETMVVLIQPLEWPTPGDQPFLWELQPMDSTNFDSTSHDDNGN